MNLADVLVIDDDESIRQTLQLVFSIAGRRVFLAENGNEGLTCLGQGFKGIVLLDIMMPELNGWETLAEIVRQNLHRGNVISMMTAVHDPGPELESLTEVVIDYLRKPFDGAELIAFMAYLDEIAGCL
jgi:DNA-binding response OmpR family regulator